MNKRTHNELNWLNLLTSEQQDNAPPLPDPPTGLNPETPAYEIEDLQQDANDLHNESYEADELFEKLEGCTKSKKVSGKEFKSKTLNRFKEYEKKRRDKLVLQKKEQFKKRMKEYTLTPKINRKRRGPKAKHESLLNRLDQIIETRKAKHEDKKKKYKDKDQRDLEECTFSPRILSKGPQRSINDLFDWHHTKKRKLMDLSLEKSTKSKEETFKPKISKKSKQMMRKKVGEDPDASMKVEDRLMRYLQKKNKSLLKKKQEKDNSFIAKSPSRKKRKRSCAAGETANGRGQRTPPSARMNRAFALRCLSNQRRAKGRRGGGRGKEGDDGRLDYSLLNEDPDCTIVSGASKLNSSFLTKNLNRAGNDHEEMIGVVDEASEDRTSYSISKNNTPISKIGEKLIEGLATTSGFYGEAMTRKGAVGVAGEELEGTTTETGSFSFKNGKVGQIGSGTTGVALKHGSAADGACDGQKTKRGSPESDISAKTSKGGRKGKSKVSQGPKAKNGAKANAEGSNGPGKSSKTSRNLKNKTKTPVSKRRRKAAQNSKRGKKRSSRSKEDSEPTPLDTSTTSKTTKTPKNLVFKNKPTKASKKSSRRQEVSPISTSKVINQFTLSDASPIRSKPTKSEINQKYSKRKVVKNVKKKLEESIIACNGTSSMLSNLTKINKKLQHMNSLKTSPINLKKGEDGFSNLNTQSQLSGSDYHNMNLNSFSKSPIKDNIFIKNLAQGQQKAMRKTAGFGVGGCVGGVEEAVTSTAGFEGHASGAGRAFQSGEELAAGLAGNPFIELCGFNALEAECVRDNF